MRRSLNLWGAIVTVTLSSWFAAGAAAAAPPPIPAVATHGRDQAFPPPEKRRNHEGSVLLEFSIDEKGQANHIKAIESSSDEFSNGAKRLLKGVRFAITKEWTDAGGTAVRYRYGFVFDLLPCAKSANPWGGDLVVINICTSALPGSPPPKVLERR